MPDTLKTDIKIQKLIIIDDEEVEQMLNRFIVERSNLVGEMVSFLCASEALSYLKDNVENVDAVLLDLNMPMMSGFDFLDSVHKELGPEMSDISFSILTSSVDSRDIDRAKGYDMVKGYFSKPLTKAHLQDICAHMR